MCDRNYKQLDLILSSHQVFDACKITHSLLVLCRMLLGQPVHGSYEEGVVLCVIRVMDIYAFNGVTISFLKDNISPPVIIQYFEEIWSIY